MNRESAIKRALWKGELQAIRERSLLATHKQELVAFYGSSSIRMWEKIEEDLAPHQALNLGFGGSSYYWCNYFFGEVFEYVNPSKIILYAGDNDLGSAVPQDDILGSVRALLAKIEAKYAEVPVAIVSVKPSPDRQYLQEKIQQLNAALADLIRQQANGSFITIYSEMLDQEGNARPDLFLEDQLHMNWKGYEIWRKVILEHLDGSLKAS